MPEMDITANFEVQCERCKGYLNVEVQGGLQESVSIIVEPCENCMKDEYTDGYEEGMNTGYENCLEEHKESLM